MEWMVAITGLPTDILILVLLAIAGAFAGFVDSIVGGGGLISVPARLLTNVPPSVALGSNKLSSIFGAGSAAITFLRNGMVDFNLVRKLLPFTFIGSILGTIAVVSMPPLCEAFDYCITSGSYIVCSIQKRLGRGKSDFSSIR